MIKVGFIDYFLDEWHANNYPRLLKEHSNGRYEVCYAYGKIDKEGGLTNEEWSKKYNVPLCDTIEEVIEKSDVLMVLSPDNPEMHEELCELPLKSGKKVYVDKTFAPDKETAIRIFDVAKKYNTPCFSSSALRFATEFSEIDKDSFCKVYSEGPGTFSMYSIHQFEPIMKLFDCAPEKIMALDTEKHPTFVIEFTNGKLAQMYHRNSEDCGFRMTVVKEDNMAVNYIINSDYFGLFIDAVVEFFDTGVIPVKSEQTIGVIALIEKANQALKEPFKWFEI